MDTMHPTETDGPWTGFMPAAVWRERARRAGYQSRTLARQTGRHARTLRRHFRRQFHTTPQRWLEKLRLAEAEKLLRAGKRTKEIYQTLGYRTASHFCRHFQQTHGLSPQAWRRKRGK